MSEARKTEYLSVRIDEEERARIEGIRDELHERNGVMPPRSDIIRTCLALGITSFCEERGIDLPESADEVEKTSKKSAYEVVKNSKKNSKRRAKRRAA